MVLMELHEGSGDANTFEKGNFQKKSSCEWTTTSIVHLPKSVDFTDYSDLARRGSKLAVTSQASAKLFIGPITLTEEGLLDPETFSVGEGHVFHFAPGDL